MDAERTKFVDLEEAFVEMMTTPQDLFHTNTTIGCIVCNARFDKAKLNKNCFYGKKCVCEMHQSGWNYG